MAYISRVRRYCGVGVVLAAVLLVGSCRGSTQTVKDAEGQGVVANPNRPVQLLLRERADKLSTGDVEGYLAALSPPARAFEEPIAKVAVTLPVTRFDLSVGEATISDDGNHFRNASVTLTYWYKELPADNAFRVRLLYDLDRQSAGWVVTKSQFDRRPFVPPPPELWPFGPVGFTRSPHFLVMARPGTRGVPEMAAVAEKAYAGLVPTLPVASDDRVLLVVAGNRKEYLDNAGDPTSVALAPFALVPAGGGLLRPEERRVFADLTALLAPGRLPLDNSPDPIEPETVFRHELAHLALSRFTRACTSDWVVEGAAMQLAGEHRSDQWKALASGGKLDGAVLNSVPPNYALADAAVDYLVQTGGAAKFLDFYRNFKNLPEQGCSGQVGNVRSRVDERLLRRYYRFGVTDLEGFARDYIRKAVAAP